MSTRDDLLDIQAVRARVLKEARMLLRWADGRSGEVGQRADDAARSLIDWCSDDIWLAECAAIDAVSSEIVREITSDRRAFGNRAVADLGSD